MAVAASVCSFDWRSGLGVLRSDLNWFTPEARARNYARLSQLTGQSSQMQASIGAAALLAGEKQVGNRFLHDYLARIPRQVIAIASSFVQQMPPDVSPVEVVRELQLILPDSLLSRAEVAEDFSRKPGLEPISEQLASSINLEDLVAQAEQQSKEQRNSKPWLLVAWLANDRLDSDTQIQALKNATAAEPMNHMRLFELAELLSKEGREAEAIQQAQKALSRSPGTERYKDFLNQKH